MEDQIVDDGECVAETVVITKSTPTPKPTSKKEEPMNPRLKAKLAELSARGLLTTAKAYKSPSDGK